MKHAPTLMTGEGLEEQSSMRIIKANRYTGFEAPVTMYTTSTFNWESLDFGHRSFWDLDVSQY